MNEAIDVEIVPTHEVKRIVFGDVETTWWEGSEGRGCSRECDRVGNQIEYHQSHAVVDEENMAD